MRKHLFLSTILFLAVLSTSAQIKGAYIPGVPPPPASMDPDQGNTAPDDPRLQHRVDPAKLQEEAENLARAAQTIPSDIASIRRGTLPKDTLEKLKDIEKLSKRLRSELKP
jgi:hypothetical protein